MIKKFCLPVFLLLICIQVSGETLPDSTLQMLKAKVELSPGEVLYIDFWASWCNPCRKSFPWMNEMLTRYQSKGLKILAVNVDKNRALADKFLASITVNFPVMYDPEGDFAKQFKLKGMPSSYLINSDGEVLIAHKGFFEDRVTEYENEIRGLLTN